MAWSTIAAIAGKAIVGTVASKAASSIIGGGGSSSSSASRTSSSSGPAVASTTGLMLPVTDSGNIVGDILSQNRGVSVAEVSGEGSELASASKGTDPILLAKRVHESLQEDDE